MAQSLGDLQVRLGADTRGLVTGFKQAGGTMKAFAATAERVLAPLMALTVGAGGMMALVAAMKEVTDVGAKFEQVMATVGGVMRATADEQQRLTKIAREMGETTEWSATQAGEALQFLGMAGFTANKAIKALPGTLDLATAGQIDLGRAADIATNALTAMGLDVEQLSRVNDVFVGTITRSNTNMEMMAESFKYAAPMARAYGYSIEELSGLIGMLGNAGIQGSMAGTQLARAMMKAKDISKKFNFESSELVDVLESLRATGWDAADVIELFGGRAGKAAGVLFESTQEARKFQDQLYQVGGEAQRLADIMRNTFEGTRKELKSTIESLKISAFREFRDELVGAMKSITAWIRDNKYDIIITLQATVMLLKDTVQLVKDVAGALESMGSKLKFVSTWWLGDTFSQTDMSEAAKALEKLNQVIADSDARKLEKIRLEWDALVESMDPANIPAGFGTAFFKPVETQIKTALTAMEKLKKSLGDLPKPIRDIRPLPTMPLPAFIKDDDVKEVAYRLAVITEKYDILGEWLESWAGRISMGMQNALENTFFDWMEGRIEGIRGLFQSLADDVFRMMSRMVAQKAAVTVMESIGLGIPTFQHGGIVTQPTLALIGERGPEAVVPLSGRQDESLLSRIASRMGGGGGDSEPMNVTVNISTPNPQAFRESKSQVAAQMAVALTAAGRNL